MRRFKEELQSGDRGIGRKPDDTKIAQIELIAHASSHCYAHTAERDCHGVAVSGYTYLRHEALIGGEQFRERLGWKRFLCHPRSIFKPSSSAWPRGRQS